VLQSYLRLRASARTRMTQRRCTTAAVVAVLAASVPVVAPLPASASVVLTTTELWGDRNPGETGTGFLGAGLPVNPDTGNLVIQATDLSIGGRGRGLLVARTYNAQDAATAGAPDALGYGWSFTYGRHLNIDAVSGTVTVAQENGSTVTFTPVVGGGFTAPPQVIATLAQNAGGTYTYTLPNQASETFSAAGVLLSESDRNHYTTVLSYTGGQLTSVTDPAGRSLTIRYDGNSRLASITDPAARVVQYGYDTAGNLVTVTDVGGGVTTYGYDSLHRVTSVTDQDGGVTAYAYDSANRVTTITDGANRVRQLRYGPGGTTVTDGLGHSTLYQYTGDLLTTLTRGAATGSASVAQYGYDSAGNRNLVVDGNGAHWPSVYDAHGNRLQWTDPAADSWSATYDSCNDVTRLTDPLGYPTTYYYDANCNLAGASRPLYQGSATPLTVSFSYGYDVSHPGDLISYTSPLTTTWTFVHDATTGDLLSVTDPLHGTTSATYNGIDWPMSTTTPRGNLSATPSLYTTTVTRNAWGDPLTVTDPDSTTSTTTYFLSRRVHTRSDGHSTFTWTYNPAGDVTQVARPDGVWKAGYDAAGHVATQTDGMSRVTSFTYDPVGRLGSVTDPGLRTTTFGYDGVDNRTLVTDPMSRQTAYVYDVADRLREVHDTSPTGAMLTSYTYYNDGRMATMSDAGTTSTSLWTYDSLGRMLSSSDGQGRTVRYGYDLAGRLTAITYPIGMSPANATPGTVGRSYDDDNHLASVTDWGVQAPTTLTSTSPGHTTLYRYDADGNLVHALLGNGINESLTYDNADALTGMTAADQQNVTLLTLPSTRGQDGLVASASPTGVAAAPTEAYTYDSELRLATATPSNSTMPTRSYGYDAADDLTAITTGAATTQLTYDPAGELASTVAQPAGVVTGTYTSDARGERSSHTDGAGTVSTYTWDQRGHMASYAGPVLNAVNGQTSTTQQELSFTYDGNGLRTAKHVAGSTSVETFGYDLAEDRPLMLLDGSTQYITGAGGFPIEQVTPAGTFLYYLTDPSGSTRLITDQNDRVVQAYTYDHYGTATPAVPSLVQPFQFQGDFADVETGLLFAGGRYYDPATGQFLSRAPAGTGPQRPYVAAADNPLSTRLESAQAITSSALGTCVAPVATEGSAWSDVLRDACARATSLASTGAAAAPSLIP